MHSTLQGLLKEVWKVGIHSGTVSEEHLALKEINGKRERMQGTDFLWICRNYCLMQTSPQSPEQSVEDQTRLEPTLVLISKYHTLTGTRTTIDAI